MAKNHGNHGDREFVIFLKPYIYSTDHMSKLSNFTKIPAHVTCVWVPGQCWDMYEVEILRHHSSPYFYWLLCQADYNNILIQVISLLGLIQVISLL